MEHSFAPIGTQQAHRGIRPLRSHADVANGARSVLLASNYQAWPEAFNGQAYAFLNVIAAVEDAELACPTAPPHAAGRGVHPSLAYLRGELLHRANVAVRRWVGAPPDSNAQALTVQRDHDLFFFMCQFPRELAVLSKLRHWRERSGAAVAYLLETWPEHLHAQRAELRVLDRFDHVFVLNAACVDALRNYTRTPVSFLPSACDTLLATPLPRPPQRCIDVLSIGRRHAAMHGKLLAHARDNPQFFYMHDVIRGGAVTDWAAHRLQGAAMIKRARYFIAYDFSVDDAGHFKGVHKQALATRYFEGAAGGAVLLGSRQRCPEFDEYFDWPDAVIELPPDTADVAAFLAELDAQPARIEAIRRNNMVQSLRRHDWAHRWARVLETLNLPRSGALDARLALLGSMAALAERTAPSHATSMQAAADAIVRGNGAIE